MNPSKKFLILFLALILVLPLIVFTGCEAGEHFANGYDLYKQDKYEQAMVELTKCIEANPNHPDAYDYRGRCYVYLKQYDRAIADLSVAIGQNTKDPYHYYFRGAAYARNGQRDLAIADFNKVLQLSDDAELIQFTNNELDRLKISNNNTTFVTTTVPAEAIACNDLGVTLAKEGKADEAIAQFTKAIQIYPDYSLAYTNRGIIYLNQEEYTMAIFDFSYAIEIDDTYAVAYEDRAIAYGEEGQFEEALADFDKAVEIDPNDDGTWNNRGMALEELGQPEEAVESYDKALELNPDNKNARDNKNDVIATDYKPLRGCLAVRTGQPCLNRPWTPERVVYHGRPYSHSEYGPRVEEKTTGPQVDQAAVAREVADNYMYSGQIMMRNALAQVPQGTNWNYTYAIQQPQYVSGTTWSVSVNVYFSTTVTVEDFSYSVGLDGLEVLMVDVNSRQVTGEEVISYTMR